MKKLVSVAIAVLFALSLFQIAWADRPTPDPTPTLRSGRIPPGLRRGDPSTMLGAPAEQRGRRRALFGTVASLGADSFTLSTKQGTETISVSASTKFHIPGKRNATFADLAVGDRVAVNGTPTASGLDAKQVAVAPGRPTIQHRVGTVTAYAAGSSITIQTVRGESETFALTAQTVIRNPKGTGVVLGDRVTVVSRREPASDTFTATGIVVHPN